jgi:hypothetical protein
LPKVVILRNVEHEGLIRSRLRGAAYASAPILVFLDTHTEVNIGWLEPLVAPVVKNYKVDMIPAVGKSTPCSRSQQVQVTWLCNFFACHFRFSFLLSCCSLCILFFFIF